MNIPLFYRTKPTFGLDIGYSTAKIVQLKAEKKRVRVVGYGFAQFDPAAIKDGRVEKPDLIIEAVKPVLKRIAIGRYSTNRVVASLPLIYTYVKVLNLPNMSKQDFGEAVRLEAEQYIPVPINELFLEYHVVNPPAGASKKEQTRVLVVAAPKQVVNSMIGLFEKLGLEVAGIEPSMFANVRSVLLSGPSEGAQIVIDFGAQSSDLAIFDNGIQLTSSLNKGNDHITDNIAKALKLSTQQANKIKIRYGIGRSRWQEQLATALAPILGEYANEVQKMMRYYHERSNKQAAIKNISVVGGGANMPGLPQFLEHLTGLDVIVCDPWQKLEIKPLQPPHPSETTLYTTAVGLALKEFVNG